MKRYIWVLSSVLLAGAALFSLFLLMDAGSAQAAPRLTALGSRSVELTKKPPTRPALRPLQQSTPVYTVTDSVGGDVDYDWIEIRGSGGQVVPGLDPYLDGSDSIGIGFYFPFYENVYNRVRVSTNGYLYFDNSEAYGNETPGQIGAGDPDNIIAAFGSLLYLPQTEGIGDVYYRQDTVPERRFIVEFVNAQWYYGLNEPHTFQIVLYPDGRIKVQYRQVRFLTNAHKYVVAGIEDSTGANGVEYASGFFDEDATIQNDLAVLYDPGNSIFGHVFAIPSAQDGWEDPGWTLDFDFDLLNLTGVTTTFDVTYSLSISSSAVPTASLWPVGVPPVVPFVAGTGIVPLPNTFDRPVEVTVTIPYSAAWFDRATMHLTLTSVASPTISTTVAITYGVAHRDLSINKGLDPNIRPGPGGYFRYGLTVENDPSPITPERPAPARGVVVTDTLPLSATLLYWQPGWADVVTNTVNGQTVLTWTVGGLGSYGAEDLFLVMQATTALTVGDTITNLATTVMTASKEYGPSFTNNSVTYTFTIVSPTVRYGIDKYPDARYAGPGALVNFGINYDNVGSVPVSGTVIVDRLPVSTTFVSTTTAWPVTGSYYDPVSHTLVFTLDSLRNGNWWAYQPIGVAITLSAALEEGTVLTNSVYITTTESIAHLFDYQDHDDSSTITIIDPRADPFVDKLAGEIEGQVLMPEPGGDYTFWINYGNAGNVPAVNVVLTDTLPESFVTFLDVVDFSGNSVVATTPGLLTWEPITLTPGASLWARVDIYIHSNTPSGTSLANRVVITATGGDNITTTNDSDVVTITLRGADVTIDKHVIPAGALRVGDRLTYTVHFSHVGDPDVPATGVIISDRLPLGLTNIGVVTASDVPLASGGGYPDLTWEVPDMLEYGQDGVITITAEVDADHTWPARPTLLNQAQISTVRLEPYGHAPNSAVVTNAVELAAPAILKIGPTLALPGQLITYTIYYSNPGRLDAHSVRITDTLPVSTTFYTDTAPLTLTRIQGMGYVAWEVGTLAAGEEISFSFVVSLSHAVPPRTVLANTAVITTSDYDGDLGDNWSQWRMPVGFDLTPSYKLVNGGGGETVDPGSVVTYTVVMTNAGPFSATDVLLTDLVPPGTAYVPGSLTATEGVTGYLPPPDNTITWTGIVTGHGAVSLTFQVAVGLASRGTVIWNEAVISDTANDIVARVPITLTGPDLSGSTKEISSHGPAFGERVTYTIVLSNDGELSANAAVTDVLPLGVTYTGDGSASSGMSPVQDGRTITWTGTVVAGGRVTLTIPVTVMAAPGSLVENEASIADGTGLVYVRGVNFYASGPDLNDSTKTVDRPNVESGEQVEYHLRIYNNGSGSGIGLRMNDTAPTGVDFGMAAFDGAPIGSLTQDGNVITWTGDLDVLGEVNIRLPATVTAAPGSDVINVMELEGPPDNIISRTATVHVYSLADLAGSSKTVDKDEAQVGDTLRYTITVDNDGELTGDFIVTDTLDTETPFGGFVSWGGNAPNESDGEITWSGSVNGGSAQQLVFTATIRVTLSPAVTNTAQIDDRVGQVYTRRARTDIVEPELTAVKHNTPSDIVYPGERITYTIVMSNVTGGLAQAWLTDPIPLNTTYIPGSVGVGSTTMPLVLLMDVNFQPLNGGPVFPVYHPLTDTITWRGNIPAGEVITVTFAVWVSSTVSAGTVITNTAWVDDLGNEDPPLVRQVFNRVAWHQLYLPLVARNH